MLEHLFNQFVGSASKAAGGVSSIDAWIDAAGKIVDINKLAPGTHVWKNGKRYVVKRKRKARATRKAADIPVTKWALWGEMQPENPSINTLADLDKLYRTEIKRVLPDVIARMEAAVGVSAAGWQLRAMSTRWGSCTPKTRKIRINVRLAAYPPECLEYVVAHELTHILVPNHSPKFHELVQRVVPNEKEIRTILRKKPDEL